jgi:hypothetical protein
MLQYISVQSSLRVMYDDYEIDFCDNDYNLDEDRYSTTDIDEDYARDGQDYESLAYRHYA